MPEYNANTSAQSLTFNRGMSWNAATKSALPLPVELQSYLKGLNINSTDFSATDFIAVTNAIEAKNSHSLRLWFELGRTIDRIADLDANQVNALFFFLERTMLALGVEASEVQYLLQLCEKISRVPKSDSNRIRLQRELKNRLNYFACYRKPFPNLAGWYLEVCKRNWRVILGLLIIILFGTIVPAMDFSIWSNASPRKQIVSIFGELLSDSKNGLPPWPLAAKFVNYPVTPTPSGALCIARAANTTNLYEAAEYYDNAAMLMQHESPRASAQAYINSGNARNLVGSYAEAIQTFQKAMDLLPGNLNIQYVCHRGLCDSYLYSNKLDKSEKELSVCESLLSSINDPGGRFAKDIHYCHAVHMFYRSKFDKAAKQMELAHVTARKANANLLLWQAAIEEAKGAYDRARTSYAKLDPMVFDSNQQALVDKCLKTLPRSQKD